MFHSLWSQEHEMRPIPTKDTEGLWNGQISDWTESNRGERTERGTSKASHRMGSFEKELNGDSEKIKTHFSQTRVIMIRGSSKQANIRRIKKQKL